MAITRAEAFAPATVANMGVGFDILGLAIEGEGDTIYAELRDQPGADIVGIDGDDGLLPRESDKNVATIVANAILEMIGAEKGVNIRISKGLPIGSGLGSSASSCVAAAVAVNALFGNALSNAQLLEAALKGESFASGSPHADNVAPCLLGGITLTNGLDMSRIRRLPVPKNLHLALITPSVSVSTAAARRALPETVTLQQMVHQTGAVAALVDAIHRGDVKTMARAMESDQVVEPARAHLMPHIEEVRFAAHRAGALALVISGAGPTLCAVCDQMDVAERVANTVYELYNDAGIDCHARYRRVKHDGAQVIGL